MTRHRSDYATDQHGWAELLPERRASKPYIGNHRVPWVVVGAGVTGLACARRLAERNPEENILLLEARIVGQGASGRSSGFAVAVSHFAGAFEEGKAEEYRRVNRINQAGLDLLRTQVRTKNIDCQWSETGFHHTASDRASSQECEHFWRYLEEMEIPHTPLDQSELSNRLGTALYKTGVHVQNGALLQPAALVRGLAGTLPENVQLCEHSPVLDIQSGAPLRITLPNGEIETDKIILATNYEATRLGFLKRYLIGSTLSGSFTRVLNDDERASLGKLKQWGVLSLHGGGATVRLTADHRLCLRNTAEYNGAGLLHDKQLEQRQSVHRAGFVRRFPQLAHVPFEFAWSGVEGISRNGTNFFGQQRTNIYFSGGYNGSGLTRGTAFGTAMADYASGEESDLASDCLASLPAKWIPPRPILDVVAWWTVRSRFNGVGADR